MAVIKVEDIMGYFIKGLCVCCECIRKDEEVGVAQSGIITLDDIERGDEIYFCDRCGEQIA